MTTITPIPTGVAAHIGTYADAVAVSGCGTQIFVAGTPGLREYGAPPYPPGKQPLGRDRTISCAVVVHANDATRKQPTLASTALSIHPSVHRGALFTRVNR